ncbi:kinase-like protein [Penicillium sp. DV-2018c]|nr:kinase-like protein [Penicillium sp. DV-2018c]
MILCRFHNELEQPSRQNIISVGQFTIVHKLNNKTVRKVPLKENYYYSTRAIEIEGRIYGHLGKSKRTAQCIRWGDGFVDLRYESNGDLESYLKKTPLTSNTKYRLAQQAIEAVAFIHERDVIHSDLSARQFLVDKSYNIRLSDFGGSSLQGSDAIVMENATHFLPRDESAPNTVQSDIFALGSTVYEILLGEKPYEGMEDEEIQRLFSDKVFPKLDGIRDQQWRNIIQKCWTCQYSRARDILEDIPSVPRFRRILARIQSTFPNARLRPINNRVQG